jgi:hypothetical protein
MGDFNPLAQVKGSVGLSLTAFIFNKKSAIFKALSLSKIIAANV